MCEPSLVSASPPKAKIGYTYLQAFTDRDLESSCSGWVGGGGGGVMLLYTTILFQPSYKGAGVLSLDVRRLGNYWGAESVKVENSQV